MLRIGSLQLDAPVLLAPVAGHCDLPFRLTARECGGVGMAFTDLICPHGLLRGSPQARQLAETCTADRPLGVQLYGADRDTMCDAARWAVDQGASVVDINMGCPVDKVTKTFAGSMMLCTPGDTVDLARAMVHAVERHSAGRTPVTAKLRLGWDHGDWTAPELARRLVGVGIQAITIHGRTAAERFKGRASHEGIAAVVHAVHDASQRRVPCIGNGDIRTPLDAPRMMHATGCDGVMIARAALGAPWILRDTTTLLQTGRLPDELTLAQRLDVVGRHLEHVRRWKGDRYALQRIKQKISAYGKHLGPCKPLKADIMTAGDCQAVHDALHRFAERAGPAAHAVPVRWIDRDAELKRQDQANARNLAHPREPASAA